MIFMNFCAIIAEFNPFHNGHEYLIKQAQKTNLPVLCLMSGDFVQRGEPAIIDKYTRAKCAINAGASIVAQLPTVYSLSCAQLFAKGAIKVLKELGCSTLIIGATHTNLKDYFDLAKIKNRNLKNAMASQLDNGINYSKALINILKTKHPNADKIFTDASNILALEYIEQIINQKANITPILISRTDGGYNTNKPIKKFASATVLREYISKNQIDSCKKYIPACNHFQLLNVAQTQAIDNLLLFNLRNSTPETLSTYADYTEGLPYLINSAARTASTLNEAIHSAASKRYRLARIKKLCLAPILNITKSSASTISKGKSVVKLLAIKKNLKEFISFANKTYPKLIVSNREYNHLSKAQQLSASIDLNASNLYTIASKKPHNNDISTGTLFID